MAFNPMKLVHMKKRIEIFREDHPKFVPFIKTVVKNAAEEGTILTVTALKPDGTKYTGNIKLGANDLETLKMLMSDKGEKGDKHDHEKA